MKRAIEEAFPIFSRMPQLRKKFGLLRSDGVSELAIFIIDIKGIICYIDVHDMSRGK